MFKRAVKTLKDALFPAGFTCELCGEEVFKSRLCPACEDTLFYNEGITCPVCGRKTINNSLCPDCKQKIPLYERGVSALVYEGSAIRLVKAYKGGKRYMAEYFADLLQPKIERLLPFDAVTFVPMTKARLKERGFNQSKLLAGIIAERFGKPLFCKIEKVSETPDQKNLTRSERAENLKACFKITDKKACKGKKFLLVDDVLTTGATADAVSHKLKAAGAAGVCFAAIASVEYRQKPPAINKPSINEGEN